MLTEESIRKRESFPKDFIERQRQSIIVYGSVEQINNRVAYSIFSSQTKTFEENPEFLYEENELAEFAINTAGCNTAIGAILALCANFNSHCVDGGILSVLYGMKQKYTKRASEISEKGINRGKVIPLSMDSNYSFNPCVGETLSSLVAREVQHYAYYILIQDEAKSASLRDVPSGILFTKGKFVKTSDYDKMCQALTNMPDSSMHFTILVCLGEQTFLIQAYQQAYSIRQWLNFQEELKSPPGLISTEEICPNPIYRGIMDIKTRDACCRDIESLTKHVKHRKEYMNITGIKLSSKHPSLKMKHTIIFFRLDLNQIILPSEEHLIGIAKSS
jgi:hypothetical protein